jgi:hypothetical protein
MGSKDAIQGLAADLKRVDTVLYAYQPEDVKERFFIDGGVITGAAALLLIAFLGGVTDKLQPHAKKAGESLGEWLGKRLENLFRRQFPDDADVEEAAKRAAAVAGSASPADLERAIAATRQETQAALSARGVELSRAEGIASSLEKHARTAISETK